VTGSSSTLILSSPASECDGGAGSAPGPTVARVDVYEWFETSLRNCFHADEADFLCCSTLWIALLASV
jgi:hypothetical protein